MKRTIIVGLSLAYYCATRSRSLALRLFGVRPPGQLVVLYYHSVSATAAAGFARQMRTLAQSARVLPADYVGTLEPGGCHVAITFDDALQSVAANAFPVLRARSFHTTIFVPAGLVGCSPDWEDIEAGGHKAVSIEPVMTLEQLRSLPRESVAVGSHSLSHPRLTDLDGNSLKHELDGSRRALTEMLDRPVTLFAFPYGAYNGRVVDACRRAGYERVFGITPSLADSNGDDFVRGRVSVEPTDSRLEFYLKVHGAYAWRTQVARFKRVFRKPVPSYTRLDGAAGS